MVRSQATPVSDLSLFILILAAVLCGWMMGAWQSRSKKKEEKLPRENYELPYYFSTDIPDYALDAFISAVDVNSDTLETHLTLGAIHRRRGELERAIRIHENLVRRDGLTANQVSLAKFELALDYMKAGLFDRAEEFLQELVEKSGSHRISALHLLIDLYQDEKEWLNASYAANVLYEHLDREGRERLSHRRSHFYCEQAEQAISDKDYLNARRSIKQAKKSCPDTRRPDIVMASLELQLNHPEKAREILESIILSSDELLDDSLRLFQEICQILREPEYLSSVLEKLYRNTRSCHALVLLARALSLSGQHEKLLQVIQDAPPANIGSMPMSLFSDIDERFAASLVSNLLSSPKLESGFADLYQCHHCGFEARKYHWQCPSCRRWETLRTKTHLYI